VHAKDGWTLDCLISPSLAQKTPDTSPHFQISKIPFVAFFALIWGAYTQNFSSLASKLRDKFEVTDGRMNRYASPLNVCERVEKSAINKFLNFSTRFARRGKL